MHCILCRIKSRRQDKLENINLITPHSRKSVCGVLRYLAKMAKLSIDITGIEEQDICKICLKDIYTFDEYMVKLLEVQRRIISRLRNLTEKDEYIKLDTVLISNGVEIETTSKDIPSVETLKDVEFEMLDPDDSVEEDNRKVHTCTGAESDGADSYELIENEVKTDTSTKNIESDGNTNDDVTDYDRLEEPIGENTTNVRKYNIQVKCDLCNSVLRNKSQLRQHMKALHKPFNKIWECKICGTTARNEEYLALHMNIHEGKSVLECRYCNKQYKRKINVIEHMRKHWDRKSFQCEKCGLRFSERHTYNNHMLQHEAEEDPLICTVCKQSFKTRRTYNHHLWIHREDRPRFDCEFCGKRFLEKYRLKLHLKCHNQNEEHREVGENPVNVLRPRGKAFECIICGDIFQSNDLLNQHMKVQHDVIL